MIIRVTLSLLGTCRRCGWQVYAYDDEQLRGYARFHEIDDDNTTCVARASEISSIVITECIPQMPHDYDEAHSWLNRTIAKINGAILMTYQLPPPRFGRA